MAVATGPPRIPTPAPTLAGHAAEAHQLDDVLNDPGFLVHAEPGPLLSALPHTRTGQGQLSAAVYRLSEHLHRHTNPVDRCRILAFDAARFGARDLQDDLTTLQDHLTGGNQFAWRARFATASKPPTATTATLAGHTDLVIGVALGELYGHSIAITGSGDLTVRVWDLTEQRALAILTGHTGKVSGVAVAELNGRPIAITADYKTVRMWDLTEQRALGTPLTHDDRVVEVAKLDGRPIAITSSEEHTVRVWDLAEQRALGTPLAGHIKDVTRVEVAELDGRPIAITASQDGTVRMWDLKNRHCLDELVMPQIVRGLALGTCGRLVMAIGPDGAAFDPSAPLVVRSMPKLSFPAHTGEIFQPPSR